MLDIFRIKFPGMSGFSKRIQQKGRINYLDALLLGVIFALAFCPYSGVLYFGMLIPMTISSASGLYLPFVFAIATGIPVIIFAWLLAFTVSGVGTFYNRLKVFEIWFRRVIALLFIGVGLYYVIVIYI
jgi:threonine/homoserine/homoserine lactone efflux protein